MLISMLDRALATLTLEQLQAEQASCLTAYLALARGSKAERITDSAGRTTQYTQANLAALKALLEALDRAIATKTGDTAAMAATRRRPLHPVI